MSTIANARPQSNSRQAAILAVMILSACSKAPEGASEAIIANQAESLQRSADENTNRLIAQIEAEADAEAAHSAPAEAGNATPNGAETKTR